MDHSLRPEKLCPFRQFFSVLVERSYGLVSDIGTPRTMTALHARALVRVGNVKQRISRRALSAPCERMSGGRTHISERGTADRPVTDGASLATAVGRVCGQQHAPISAD